MDLDVFKPILMIGILASMIILIIFWRRKSGYDTINNLVAWNSIILFIGIFALDPIVEHVISDGILFILLFGGPAAIYIPLYLIVFKFKKLNKLPFKLFFFTIGYAIALPIIEQATSTTTYNPIPPVWILISPPNFIAAIILLLIANKIDSDKKQEKEA